MSMSRAWIGNVNGVRYSVGTCHTVTGLASVTLTVHAPGREPQHVARFSCEAEARRFVEWMELLAKEASQ